MPDVKISQLPAGTANASAVVPATNAAGTTTEKITLEAIVGLDHQHTISQVTDLETTLGQKLDAPESATAGDVLTYEDGSWVAAAASGGGGGGGGDYLPLAGGTMTGNIAFDGTSGQAIGKGWFDTQRGGNYGISLYCSIGYQLNWQAGWLTTTEQDLSTPRPLYLDSVAGTTLRVWDASENEGLEISHTGITFADGTTQTTAAASLPTGATEGDVLTYSSGSWVAAAPSGGGGGNPFDQELNTDDAPEFGGLTVGTDGVAFDTTGCVLKGDNTGGVTITYQGTQKFGFYCDPSLSPGVAFKFPDGTLQTTAYTGGAIASVTTGIDGADQITNIVSLTQAEYDALASKDASTFYVITD